MKPLKMLKMNLILRVLTKYEKIYKEFLQWLK